MDIAGQHLIAASRKKTWNALNDWRVLGACFAQPNVIACISPTQYRVGPPINSTVTLIHSFALQAMAVSSDTDIVRLELSGDDMGPTVLTYTISRTPGATEHCTTEQCTGEQCAAERGEPARLQAVATAFCGAFQSRVSGPD